MKNAIAAHEVLVGMNHRMVLAALGAPESKIREQQSGDPNGARYEEWIYGHVPQTVRFVRFVGDRVTVVEIAALGKPVEIHDKDEMGGLPGSPPTCARSQWATASRPAPRARSRGPPHPAQARRAASSAAEQGQVQFPKAKNSPVATAHARLVELDRRNSASSGPPASSVLGQTATRTRPRTSNSASVV